MSEADETDSESDEYVPSLEDSEDIFAPKALRAVYATSRSKSQILNLICRPAQAGSTRCR